MLNDGDKFGDDIKSMWYVSLLVSLILGLAGTAIFGYAIWALFQYLNTH